VLLWGYKMWPAIAGAAFLVNFFSPIPVQSALGIAVGNTSGALFGGFLLRRFGFSSSLARLRDVIALLTLGALVSTIAAATVGTTTLFLTHVKAWSGFETAVPVWWFGDGMGVLIATPLFLTARHARTMLGGSHRAEPISLFTGAAGTAFLVFSQPYAMTY
jgi:integral membrane sensor domain MASE1